MSVSPHEGGLGQSGLIIPENIPGDDLQPFRLEAVAGRVRQAGTQALAQAEVAEATWAGLPGVLESPQGAVMYAALGTPSSLAATIGHKFDRVAYALEEFAAAVRPIKNEFARIKEDAVAFRATIRWDEQVWVKPSETHEYQFDAQASVTASRGYVRTVDEVVEYLQGRGESTLVTGGRVKILAHWTQSSSHVDANNALMDRLADAYARLQNVEADCADAINRQRDLCMAEVQKIEAWQLKQFGENTVVLPWGSKVDEDRNCGEQFWWGAGSAAKEAGVGFLGLFGYNGVRNDWTTDQAGQSWLGAVQGIGALLVLTCPPLVLLGKAGVPVLSDATDMGDAMLKGLIAYDTWAENPAEAAGRVLVNVGSLFIPGAGEVSAAIKALTAGSRIVDAAGDAARLGESALSGLNRVDNLAGMLDNVGNAVGPGAKVDDLVSVGTKIDMPDSDLLHVATKAPDAAPPASFLDDGPSGPAPHAQDPATPAPHTSPDDGGGSTRTPAEAEGAPRLEGGDGKPYPGYHGDSGTYPPSTSPNPAVQHTLDLVQDAQAPYGRFEDGTPLTKAEYDERYVFPDGSNRYPSYDGAVPGTRVTYTDPVSYIANHGSDFDRVGHPGGKYLAVVEDGVPAPFEARGLPIDSLAKPYDSYSFAADAAMRMTEDGIQIQVSRVAPAFGQPGGALQTIFLRPKDGRLVEMTVQDLLDAGYLT